MRLASLTLFAYTDLADIDKETNVMKVIVAASRLGILFSILSLSSLVQAQTTSFLRGRRAAAQTLYVKPVGQAAARRTGRPARHRTPNSQEVAHLRPR